MFSSKACGWRAAAALLACSTAQGANDGFVIGLGAEMDTEEGRAVLDERWHVGMEIEFGLKSLDVGFSRWQTAVDQGQVDSIRIGFLTPLGKASDIEFRLAFDDSANYGRSTVLSVFGYFFGGL